MPQDGMPEPGEGWREHKESKEWHFLVRNPDTGNLERDLDVDARVGDEPAPGAGRRPPVDPGSLETPDPAVQGLISGPAPPREPEPLGVPGVPGTAPLEAAALGAPAGLTSDFSDELMARIESSANVARGALPGAQAPFTGTPARTSGRGIDAPLKSVDEYLAEKRSRLEQAAGEEPGSFYPAYAGGAVAQAMAVPGVRVAKSAPLLKKLGGGAANVGIDAALAGTAAAGASDAETIEGLYEDTVEGVGVGAGVSGALRAVPAAKAIAGAAAEGTTRLAAKHLGPAIAKRRTLGAPADVKEDAAKFLEQTPEGEALRARATTGEGEFEQSVRDITRHVTDAERGADVILTHAKVGMKAKPIAKHMQAEGVNVALARDTAATAVDDVLDQVQALQAKSRGSGTTALNKLMGTKRKPSAFERARGAMESVEDPRAAEALEALEQLQEEAGAAMTGVAPARGAEGVGAAMMPGTAERGAAEVAWQSIASSDAVTPAGAADAFVALDQLKREIGGAVRRAGRGADPDPATQDALKELYEGLRGILETDKVWGTGAATVQREVNAAWVPFIRKHRGQERLAMSDVRGQVADDPWEVLAEGDPAKIEALLRRAGTAGNELQEKALREALDAQADISEQLARHYEMPEDIASNAWDVRNAARGARQTLDTAIEQSSAARRLGEVETATQDAPGGLASELPIIGRALRAVDQGGPAPLARRLASYEAEAAAPAAQRAAEPAPVAETLSTATTATARVAGAQAVEPREPTPGVGPVSLSDKIQRMVVSDPQAMGPYGPGLRAAAEQGEGAFGVRHHILQQTDPQYQQLLRKLELEETE